MNVKDFHFEDVMYSYYFYVFYEGIVIAYVTRKNHNVFPNVGTSKESKEFVRSHRVEIREAFHKYLVKEML